MIAPSLFASRAFTVINLATLVIYAAFTGGMVFLALFLQVTAGWSPLAAGAASVPISVVMFFLAARFGRLAVTVGARTLMAAGCCVVAASFAGMTFLPDDVAFWTQLLPLVVLQGFGMSMLVAPLTGTVLSAAPDSLSGLASGINNAVSRTGGLIAVAALPMLVGLVGSAYSRADAVATGFSRAMWWCAVLVLASAVLITVAMPRKEA